MTEKGNWIDFYLVDFEMCGFKILLVSTIIAYFKRSEERWQYIFLKTV